MKKGETEARHSLPGWACLFSISFSLSTSFYRNNLFLFFSLARRKKSRRKIRTSTKVAPLESKLSLGQLYLVDYKVDEVQ